MLDYAVFIQLSRVQIELYNTFSDIVKDTSDKTKSFLGNFTIFQYIGIHPQILPVAEKNRHKKIKENDVITNDKDTNSMPNVSDWWKSKIPPDSENRIEYGNKMVVLKAIIEECEVVGDKL